MSVYLQKPCDNCPFLKKGGIRLVEKRVREICGGVLDNPGEEFHCHKTVDYSRPGEPSIEKASHCAGALIFMEKHGTAHQMARIMERMGKYDAKTMMADKTVVASVFDNTAQMIKAGWTTDLIERVNKANEKFAKRNDA